MNEYIPVINVYIIYICSHMHVHVHYNQHNHAWLTQYLSIGH